MATKTKLELAIHVLRGLNAIDATEDLTEADDDVAYVIDQYEDKYAELSGIGLELTYWDVDDIPQEIFGILSQLMQNDVQGEFGEPMKVTEKEANEMLILKKLRRHVAVRRSGLPVRAEYF